MPVIEIKSLPANASTDVSETLKSLCTEVAREMDLPARTVWATWETLEPGGYAEGSSAPQSQPEDTHGPLVNIIAFEGRTPEMIERVLHRTASVLTREMGL